MAAKGSQVKAEISQKILQTFPNSFLYNDGKEIRIDTVEDGLPVQIKVTLTAAKVPVEGNGENIFTENAETAGVKPAVTNEKIPQEPTEEEKERLTALLNKLDL